MDRLGKYWISILQWFTVRCIPDPRSCRDELESQLMLPVDEMFLRTMRGPIVFEVFASLYHGNVEVYPNLHVVDGSVTADRDQRVRRTLTCNIAIPEGETVPINVLDSRIQVWMGFLAGIANYMVPLGVFKVDRLARVNRGLISVSGSSFESYIVDNLYLGDQNDISAYPQGSNVVNSIRDVILTSFDNAVFEVLPGVEHQKDLERGLGNARGQDLLGRSRVLGRPYRVRRVLHPCWCFSTSLAAQSSRARSL